MTQGTFAIRWLAPFTQGQHHTVTITFSTDVTISMIRVWNYNKSRIHSHRGARYVEIVLDGTQIFAGEFSKANGLTEGSEDSAEHILFTTDAGTVTAIEALLQDQKEQLNQDQDLQGLAEGVGGLDLDYSQMRSSADALRPDQELGRRAELSMPQSAGGGGGASSFAPSAAFEPGAAQLCDRPFTAAGGRPEFDASAAGPPNQGACMTAAQYPPLSSPHTHSRSDDVASDLLALWNAFAQCKAVLPARLASAAATEAPGHGGPCRLRDTEPAEGSHVHIPAPDYLGGSALWWADCARALR